MKTYKFKLVKAETFITGSHKMTKQMH